MRWSPRGLGHRVASALGRLRPDRYRVSSDRSLARRSFPGPVVDVEETNEAVIVRAELPGLRADEFTAEATPDRLIVCGEKSIASEERGEGYYRMERRAGSFARVIALPVDVDPDRSEASYRDGVLVVRLPKAGAAGSHRVRIQVRREVRGSE